MRKKLLNNNLSDSISKGGVLYRAGEIPTLTTEQKEQAKLVSRLPRDFPFANWEGMTTKQQLRQMQYSGLNAQEQWSLLNTNIPLVTLNEHNHVQTQSESAALAARVAASLVNATAKAAAAKAQAAVGKPTVSTSLQNNALQQKLDVSKLDQKNRAIGRATGGIGGSVPIKGIAKAGVGSKIADPFLPPKNMPSKYPSTTPLPTKTPTMTPPPVPTPLPRSGPTPAVTPGVDKGANPIGKSAPIEFSYRDKQALLSMLDMDKSLLPVGDRKIVELIERQIQRGVTTPAQLGRFYADLLSIRTRATELEWVDDRKSESNETATWGSELINNQKDYSSVPGSFGEKGNMKANACGYMAINNVNYLLGDKTDYGHTAYTLNKSRDVTTTLGGTWGMNPFVITPYYQKKGYQVDWYINTSDVPKSGDAYIMAYLYTYTDKNKNEQLGGHYIAVAYNPSTDSYTAYNNNNNGISEEGYSLSDFLPIDHKLYVIWVIEDPNKPQNVGSASEAYDERY